MVNKKIWGGILVMVLVFGMTVVGCDSDDGNDDKQTAWIKWGDAVTFSVSTDDIVTVNVIQYSDSMDTCGVQLPYSGIKNKTYKYTFEAWTKSSERDLRVCFGSEKRIDDSIWYPNEVITITSIKQTYNLTYDISGNWQNFLLGFNCGGDIGEFYIKIISIEPLS